MRREKAAQKRHGKQLKELFYKCWGLELARNRCDENVEEIIAEKTLLRDGEEKKKSKMARFEFIQLRTSSIGLERVDLCYFILLLSAPSSSWLPVCFLLFRSRPTMWSGQLKN